VDTHRNFETLEALWTERAEPYTGRVDVLVVRGSRADYGPENDFANPLHSTPEEIQLSVVDGIAGDRWKPEQGVISQVSLMSTRAAELVAVEESRRHLVGDNIIADLDLRPEVMPAGARLRIGAVVLEVTEKEHRGCKRFGARFGEDARRWIDDPEHRLRGRFARVVSGGAIRIGDLVVREGSVRR
jgi:hypothetical protein